MRGYDVTTLKCDVCLVGSGAAGMTIGCELAGSRLDVILLEAGGARYEPRYQAMLRGEVSEGSAHYPPHMFRRCMLGGATTIWGGRCVPLSPIDLEPRDYVPYSGWPISWHELERYYPAAQEYCEAGGYSYTVTEAIGRTASPTIAGFADPNIETSNIERFSPPTDFGKTLRARMAQSANVRILLHTRVVRLHEEGRTIAWLEALTEPERRRIMVIARHYVLAIGGLEIPRLLMLSDDTRRGGIGNQGNALGRFYMCHAENTLGLIRLQPAVRPVMVDIERTADGIYACRKITVARSTLHRERLLNTTARLHYPFIADPAHGSPILSTMYLLKDLMIREHRDKIGTIEISNRNKQTRDVGFWIAHLNNMISGAPEVARFGIYWLRCRILARRKLPFVALRSRNGIYPFHVNAEQVPDRENAVTLTDTLDGDGQRQLRVKWQLTDQDVDSVCRFMRLLREAVARSGCGDVLIDDARIEEQVRSSTPVGGHHIGTARMADDPTQGVVDRHCRVHGLDNLHLAGAAVFPTCGHANPTLTIVALSVRLAERLRSLASGAPPAR